MNALNGAAGVESCPKVDGPTVVVVILNWNGRDDTLSCIASAKLLDFPCCEILVVDNGSADGSAEAVRTRFTDIPVIETGHNLGYAGGNNVGINWALERGAEYVLLLNNDTVVSQSLLTEFVGAARTHQDGGMFSARIDYFTEPGRIWNSGVVWNRRLGRFDSLDIKSGVRETAAINGCALFVPSHVIRRIGLMDEQYFLTYEETDWSYRARAAGYRCYVVADALVRHKVSASIGGSESPLACYFWVRNQLFWAKRHLPLRDRLAAWMAIFRRIRRSFIPPFVSYSSASVVKGLFWAGTSWWRDFRRNLRSHSNRAFLIGMRDYMRGRMGDCPDNIRHWTEAAKARARLSAEAKKLDLSL